MREPVEKYQKWMDEHPDEVSRAVDLAKKLYGYTDREIDQKMKRSIWWLETNGHRADIRRRRAWGRYLKNFLKPRDWDGRARSPKKVTRATGEISDW